MEVEEIVRHLEDRRDALLKAEYSTDNGHGAGFYSNVLKAEYEARAKEVESIMRYIAPQER